MTNIRMKSYAKQRLRILIVSNDCDLGGASLSMLDMIKAIRDDVDVVVVLNNEGELSNELNGMGVDTYIVPFERDYLLDDEKETSKNVFASNFNAAVRVAEIIRKENIDVVHTNSSVGNVGAFSAILADKPHIWHIRELVEEDYSAHYFDYDAKKELFGMSTLIAISNCVSKMIESKYGIKSKVVYDAVSRSNNEYVNKTRNNKSMLLVGRISEDKCQLDAIKAIKILRDRGYKDLTLTLVGSEDAKYRWIIDKYVKKNNLEDSILIKGFTKDLDYMRALNGVSIVASRMEALGRVVVESMYSGQFVIGANTGGVLELIGKDEKRGFLFKQGSPDSLANSIERFFDMTESERGAILEKAYKFSMENFGYDNYSTKIIELYQNQAATKRHYNKKIKQIVKNGYHTIKTYNPSIPQLTCENKKKCQSKADYIRRMWNVLDEKGLYIADFFHDRCVEHIAIYGMGYFGMRLYDSIEDSSVFVDYVIDMNPRLLKDVFLVESPDNPPLKTQMIVVTVSNQEEEIIRTYKEYNDDCQIVGITEIIDSFCMI